MSVRINPPPVAGLDLSDPLQVALIFSSFAREIENGIDEGMKSVRKSIRIPTNNGNQLLSNIKDKLPQRGDIWLFYGTWGEALAKSRSGWAICDGLQGTPPLHPRPGQTTQRFPRAGLWGVGYSQGSSGATGGCSTHGHTATSGSHTHTGTTASHCHVLAAHNTDADGVHIHGGAVGFDGSTSSCPSHSHTVSITGGGDHGHSCTMGTDGAHNHSVSLDGGSHSHSTANSTSYKNVEGCTGTPSCVNTPDHTHTVNDCPSHTHSGSTTEGCGGHGHSWSISSVGCHVHSDCTATGGDHFHVVPNGGSHTHSVPEMNTGTRAPSLSINACGSVAITVASGDNLPPYCDVIFLMKL